MHNNSSEQYNTNGSLLKVKTGNFPNTYIHITIEMFVSGWTLSLGVARNASLFIPIKGVN
jgi:hypothetical protein